jgi:hypothetical protein
VEATRAWTIGAMVIAIAASLLAYQSHLDSKTEESRRIRADELRLADVKAREASEAKASAADERARRAEDRAENLEASLRIAQERLVTTRSVSPTVGYPEPAIRTADAVARADAAELARIDRLKAECDGFRRAGPGLFSGMAAQRVCGAYYEAAKKRQYYEAARTGQSRVDCNPKVRNC